MNGSANVQTFDAIHTVRAALVSFGDQVDQALAMIDIEMRRVLDWLEHDRPRFWRNQVRMAMDGVTEARAALHRCLMYPVADERPSCTEERAALKKALAHLAYCEDKSERLTHWIREVRHELLEYKGRIGQLSEIVEFDVPQAVGILAKLLARLEEYQAIRQHGGDAPSGEAPPGEAPPGEAASAAGDALAEHLWPAQPDNTQEKDPRPLSKPQEKKASGG